MSTAERRHLMAPDYGIAYRVTEHEFCSPKQVFERHAQDRGRIQSDSVTTQ